MYNSTCKWNKVHLSRFNPAPTILYVHLPIRVTDMTTDPEEVPARDVKNQYVSSFSWTIVIASHVVCSPRRLLEAARTAGRPLFVQAPMVRYAPKQPVSIQ